MMKKIGAALIVILFSTHANAEGGSKLLPWNWGKKKQTTQAPPPVEKIYPTQADMSPTPSNRTRISIPTNTKTQQAEAMVQQRMTQAATQKKLSPEESNLRLPNFFSQTGNPDIPTLKNEDNGTYITESFFTGLATHEIVNDVTYHGFKLSDLLGDSPDLSSFQDMAHTGLMVYLAEHPATGGKRDRGYRPQFIPSFVRFVTETYPLMLESGELLYPRDRALQYIATGFPVDQDPNIDPNLKVAFNQAQIAMTDTDGNILGPNMYPIFAEAKVDSENKTYFTSDMWAEMAAYSKGFETFLNQQVLMAFPLPRFAGNPYASAPYQEAESRRKIREDLYNVTPLSECFKLMAKLKFSTARECFKQRKEELMYRELSGAENYSTLKDFKDAAIRGAIAGGVVTEISGAMDLGTGIGVGALANSLRVAYNRYLRKEDQFTQEQFDSLMSMINMYTFAPGPDGIIHPKKGMWKVLENGIIYRYRSEAVLVGYRKDKATGARTPITGMKDFPLDLYGRDQMAEVGFRIQLDKKANVDTGPVRAYGHLVDIRRSENRTARRAAAQLRTLKEVADEEDVDEKSVKDVQPQKEEQPPKQESATPSPKAATAPTKEIAFPPLPPKAANSTTKIPEATHSAIMQQPNMLLPPVAGKSEAPSKATNIDEITRNLPIPPPPTEGPAVNANPPAELNVAKESQ